MKRKKEPDTDSSSEGAEARATPESALNERASPPVVCVGGSAGGIEAMRALLHALPTDTGMTFVFILHLDPTHASQLDHILSRVTTMPVAHLSSGMRLESNHVYVLPPDCDVRIKAGLAEIERRAEMRPHLPIDHCLRSLAEDHCDRCIGVVLSGMGHDGTIGLQELKAAGGITFVQDESAEQSGMPHSAIASGIVDFVLPPDEIAREIGRLAHHPYVARAETTLEATSVEPLVRQILDTVRDGTGIDFSGYKRSTLLRRISRRMLLHKLDDLRAYHALLRGSAREIEALFQDILISVTSFFRDKEAFAMLQSRIVPKLLLDRARNDTLRVWVLGCSTGEEAYSIAIALTEAIEASDKRIPVQIFATDLNGRRIEQSRGGTYPRSIADVVSPERLKRFFLEVEGGYRVSKSIRDMCVFARQDLMSDPPFSRIDLISCRNMMIYLDTRMQQQILPILHYALRPSGILWLGKSESIGGFRELFEPLDAHTRFFTRRPSAAKTSIGLFASHHAERDRSVANHPPLVARSIPPPEPHKEADRILLGRYAPPSVVVDGDMEILQFRGDTSAFLAPAQGRASLNLLKMLREGLLVGVRGAFHKAKRELISVHEAGLQVVDEGALTNVDVTVIPLKAASARPTFLIVFDVPGRSHVTRVPGSDEQAGKDQGDGSNERPAPSERDVRRLEQELDATREYLQSVIEQQEAVNEELQAANEEVQSANEELQTINEEMETSKEEIESSNEELATVNDELHIRNVELGHSNNDLQNLLASVEMAIVMIGPDLRIRRFTPAAQELLHLIPADVGRPMGDLKLDFDLPELQPILERVIQTGNKFEKITTDQHQRWFSIRVRPYRTDVDKIEGVVLVFVDVDALKRGEERIRRQAELLEQAHDPIFTWTLDGTITFWNRGAEETYGFTRAEAVGRVAHALLSSDAGWNACRKALEERGTWTGEIPQRTKSGETIVVESRMSLMNADDGTPTVLETVRPITERKRTEEALRLRAQDLLAADRAKNEFLAMLAHELRNPLASLHNAVQVMRSSVHDEEMLEHARATMERQTHNMVRMVEDLLETSRVSQGKIDLHREIADLVAIARRAVDVSTDMCRTRRQKLDVDLPDEIVLIEADSTRLEQVFVNLMSNASKFTQMGGDIRMSMRIERVPPSAGGGKGRGEAIVSVRDNGIGIEPAMLSPIFDLFVQVDASLGRVTGGLGIGLTLVRKLVELHGGTVSAFSDGLGHGSEFVVRLPLLAPQSRAALPSRQSAQRAPSPLRILVVDDNTDSGETMAYVLRLSGHDTRIADSGPRALEIAKDFVPEVVLMDIGMPGMDGYTAARHLRTEMIEHRPLLIAVTGYTQDAHLARAREAGFDHHLAKPVEIDALRRLLETRKG